jgi:tRNA pseudouridine55 synthase
MPVEEERPWAHIGVAEVQAVLPQFTGAIMQRPPDFSAKRFEGERAYHLARKGEHVDLPPVALVIHSIELIGFQRSGSHVGRACSKGTYLRSLAHDIGQALGMRRAFVGPAAHRKRKSCRWAMPARRSSGPNGSMNGC